MRFRRHDTVDNLAAEFSVSEKTIRSDLITLSLSYPITTKPGPGGGIIWTGNRPTSVYTEREIKAIQNAIQVVSPEDAAVLERLIRIHSIQKPFAAEDVFRCLECGITQTQLADKLGIKKGTLSNIMAGRRMPGANLAKKISELKNEILKNNTNE